MSCYFVAQITIRDQTGYRRYEDGFDAVFDRYKGAVVAVDDHPVVVEGQWSYTRLVLIRFPDLKEARRWYDSPEYRTLAAIRDQTATSDVLFVEGRD